MVLNLDKLTLKSVVTSPSQVDFRPKHTTLKHEHSTLTPVDSWNLMMQNALILTLRVPIVMWPKRLGIEKNLPWVARDAVVGLFFVLCFLRQNRCMALLGQVLFFLMSLYYYKLVLHGWTCPQRTFLVTQNVRFLCNGAILLAFNIIHSFIFILAPF